MSRMMLVGWLTLGLFAAVSADVMAQRDSGAKARGEVGRGFWSRTPAYGSFYAGPSYYQPLPGVESYRSFSYEPVGIGAEDRVVVKSGGAPVMVGRRQVGTLQEGQEFKVTRVVDGWLGAIVEQEGSELRGWVWSRNATLEATAASAAPPAAREAAPVQEYRRFSYEPLDVPAVNVPAQSPQRAQRATPPQVRLHPGSRRY